VVVNSLTVPPPPVILVLGELLAMRAIITRASVQWGPQFEPNTMLPLSANVDVTFTALHIDPGSYQFQGPSRFDSFQPPETLGQTASKIGRLLFGTPKTP
jgi:hypothetical protein